MPSAPPRPPRHKLQPLLGLLVLLLALAALASASASSTIEGIFGGVQLTKGSLSLIERAAELAKDKQHAVVAPLHLAACMFDTDSVSFCAFQRKRGVRALDSP